MRLPMQFWPQTDMFLVQTYLRTMGLSIIYNLNIILHVEFVRMLCWVQYTSFYTNYSDFSFWLTLAALKSRCDFETKYIG